MILASGGFLGKSNKLYKFPIKEVKFFNSLLELKERQGFVVISYKLSEETLGVKVKASSFPSIVFVEVGEPVEFEPRPKPFKLSLKDFSLNKKEYIERVQKDKRGD
jgi:para-aminobenzoate synthetase component 1